MTITEQTPDIVLQLADHEHTLAEVTPLAKRGAAPTLWSVTIKTDGTLRGILATEARMVELLRYLLDQADAVIVCGGLGPTQDDITREAIAEVMGTRHVPLPPAALRTAARLSWRLRLQPTSPGWVDLALTAPLLDATKAFARLGWAPRHNARDTLRQLLDGLARKEGLPPSPPLRP